MTSPKIFFKIFKGRDLISLPYFYYPYCNKKSINFLIKRRTKMDTPIAAAIHTIEKNIWKITWLSIAYETALFIVSPPDYLLILHYTISLYFSILHFLYFLHLLAVFLLKYAGNLTPSPVLTSLRKLSNPQPNFLVQKNKVTKAPRGSILYIVFKYFCLCWRRTQDDLGGKGTGK